MLSTCYLSKKCVCAGICQSHMPAHLSIVQCCISDQWATEEDLLALAGICTPQQWTNKARILTQDWQKAKAQTLHLFSDSRGRTSLTIFHFLKEVCECVCPFQPQLNPDVTCSC